MVQRYDRFLITLSSFNFAVTESAYIFTKQTYALLGTTKFHQISNQVFSLNLVVQESLYVPKCLNYCFKYLQTRVNRTVKGPICCIANYLDVKR